MSTKPVITPVSAPPAAKLTPEEREQRFKSLRERMGRSMIEVTPPAGKVAYWAHTTDTRELGRLDWLGYKIVHDDPKSPAWIANGMKEDGTYVIGDVILMEIDADTKSLIDQEYISQHENMMVNTKKSFMNDAEGAGVPTFEVAKAPRR